MEKIYNPTSVNMLLGCLLQDSSLVLSDKYPLDKTDFCLSYQKFIYVAIFNLYKKGNKSIGFMELDTYLSKYPEQYEVFKDCGGRGGVEDYIDTLLELSNLDNYEGYYNDVRKMSVLRDYRDNGFDIDKFWDYNKSDDNNLRELESVKIEEIVNYFDAIQNEQRKKYIISQNIEVCDLGHDYSQWLDEQEEDPMIGASICSPYLNSLYRGWCEGHFILRGSPSSFGKTLMGVADQINVSSKKIWSEEKKDFIENPYYQGRGAYIHTEQKIKEIGHRFGSTISGVPYHIILDGSYRDNKDYRERLDEAGKIMKDSGLRLINMPEFTSSIIKEWIKSLALDGFKYITDDYIWNNFHIVADLKKTMGVNNILEYQALLYYADTLKMQAEKWNVGIASMMQLNGNEKVNELVDESCLFAGRQVKTKLDNGSIYMYPRPKELQLVEPLIVAWNKANSDKSFGEMVKPNAISHVFKARFNRYGQNLKVWHNVDNGIGRMTDMFVTTWDNKLPTDENGKVIKIEPINIIKIN